MSRPEDIAPPEIFYNAEEARKYTSNSHMIETQVRAPSLVRRLKGFCTPGFRQQSARAAGSCACSIVRTHMKSSSRNPALTPRTS